MIDKENHVELTATEARQGRKGYRILTVLIASLILGVFTLGLLTGAFALVA